MGDGHEYTETTAERLARLMKLSTGGYPLEMAAAANPCGIVLYFSTKTAAVAALDALRDLVTED